MLDLPWLRLDAVHRMLLPESSIPPAHTAGLDMLLLEDSTTEMLYQADCHEELSAHSQRPMPPPRGVHTKDSEEEHRQGAVRVRAKLHAYPIDVSAAYASIALVCVLARPNTPRLDQVPQYSTAAETMRLPPRRRQAEGIIRSPFVWKIYHWLLLNLQLLRSVSANRW
jgi:hypothetical protein